MKNFIDKSLIIAAIAVLAMLTGCVSQKKHDSLIDQYNRAVDKYNTCLSESKRLSDENDELKSRIDHLDKVISRLKTDSTETHSLYDKTRKLYEEMSNNYERLLKQKQEESTQLSAHLKALEARLNKKELELVDKEAALLDKEARLARLLDSVQQLAESNRMQQQKVEELRRALNAKDSTLKAMRDDLKRALKGFEDGGLTVETRDGMIYVSMEERLLFKSGSIVVDPQGQKALVELSKALRGKSNFTVIVEGHTDKIPMRSAQIKDNWDLSVLRATSIIRIITGEGGLDPKMVMAAGRGEFKPLSTGNSSADLAKNRRTEIILAPDLGKVLSILEN